ncbi:MFS transporter [Microbulbifer sp.]|uniref:MFS transporter n=1 Tax=Microbulbifer sp. TaxID=1908541 RepID=UPI002583AABE|nr:MFS transporter [Microbulbifer sp.]
MPIANPRTTLLAVLLVSLVGTAGIALPYPVLAPMYLEGPTNDLTHFMGMPPKLLLGLVLALFPLGLLLGSSVIGGLSDHFGRKQVLMSTLLLASIGYALSATALLQQNFILFAVARFLTGVCQGNIAVARAIAADLHPAIDRTRALSLAMACTYAGWLLGPLSGGYLVTLGVDAVFWFAGLAVIVCAALVQFGIQADRPLAGHRPSLLTLARAQNSLALWKEPAIFPLALFNLLFCLGVNAFYEFYPFWLVEKFGFAPHQIAWNTVAVTGTMIATSALVVPAMQRRFGSTALVLKGALALGTLLLFLPLAGLISVYPVFALIGIGIATVNGVFPALMSERFEQFGQGRIMGLLTANFCLASVIIALVGSGVALVGSHWSLVLGALLCFAGAAQFARQRHKTASPRLSSSIEKSPVH